MIPNNKKSKGNIYIIDYFHNTATYYKRLNIRLIIGGKRTPPNLNDSTIDNPIIVLTRDRLIFDLITSRHQREFERSNILDKKASQIIGFVGIIFSLFVGFYAFLIKELAGDEKVLIFYSNWRIILVIGIFSLALSILCSLKTMHVKRFFDAPATDVLINEYAKAEKDIPTILCDVGTEISNAVIDNQKINDYKADFVKYSVISFAFGMFLIMVFIAGLLIL